jgi:hypothetical protein
MFPGSWLCLRDEEERSKHNVSVLLVEIGKSDNERARRKSEVVAVKCQRLV